MINIALDGPSGAGKSTIAKRVAEALGILYLDTGAMYRALGLTALNRGIDPKDAEKVAEMAARTEITVTLEAGVQHTFADGEDVTGLIRTPEVAAAASAVSAVPAVRRQMVAIQRQIAAETDMILDGRDIGTFVLPDTPYKFFLNATPEERARRRYTELLAKGVECTFEQILRDIQRRDENDSNRAFAPLKKAEDAVEIDTTHLTIDEVSHIIIKTVRGEA